MILGKRLAWLLRHASNEVLPKDKVGYADLEATADIMNVSVEDILNIVEQDPKGRFVVLIAGGANIIKHTWHYVELTAEKAERERYSPDQEREIENG